VAVSENLFETGGVCVYVLYEQYGSWCKRPGGGSVTLRLSSRKHVKSFEAVHSHAHGGIYQESSIENGASEAFGCLNPHSKPRMC